MKVISVPFNPIVRDAIWKAFKPVLEDKHGTSGSEGRRGELCALKLLEEHFDYPVCYDHSEDVVGQLFGVDFTLISGKHMCTVDVKSQRSALYWNKQRCYWYITVREDFFDPRKTNSHIMHVGPKGDLFAFYEKAKMKELFDSMMSLPNQNVFIKDTYGYQLALDKWPPFIQHNIGRK